MNYCSIELFDSLLLHCLFILALSLKKKREYLRTKRFHSKWRNLSLSLLAIDTSLYILYPIARVWVYSPMSWAAAAARYSCGDNERRKRGVRIGYAIGDWKRQISAVVSSAARYRAALKRRFMIGNTLSGAIVKATSIPAPASRQRGGFFR